MSDPLRDRRAASELAANEQVIEISNKIGDFERLSQAIEQDLATLSAADRPGGWRDAAVSGRLAFGFDDGGARAAMLEGRVGTTVTGVCQRCLAPFTWPLDIALRLVFAEPGGPVEAGPEYEVWELDEPTLCPIAVVDEALVMALPLSAKHDEGSCRVDVEPQDAGEETTRPFASLRARMEENQD